MTEYSRMSDPDAVRSGAADGGATAKRLLDLMTTYGAEIADGKQWAGTDETGQAFHGQFDEHAQKYFPAGENVGRLLQDTFKGVGDIAVTKVNVDDISGQGVAKSDDQLPDVRT